MDQPISETILESEADGEISIQTSRKSRISCIIAAILPFVQSIPPLTIWGGLMTIPFVGYIALLFTSSPSQFVEAIVFIFFGGFPWEQIIAILGIGVLLHSVIHMRLAKKDGLIKSGLYRYVRHPQYLGVVLFTLALTTRSYWIGKNTFGMSWIAPELTVAIWFGTLFAYVVLAQVEELHLAKTFASVFEEYREETGFMVPFVKTQNRVLEIALSVLIPALILAGVLIAAPGYPPLL
ncbi:MAG: methyltransferase family protein [Candidatus Thorarchaeota archaeon]